MNNVLDDLRDPVCRESDENNQPNDFGGRTSTRSRACWGGRIVFGIDCDEGYGKPSAKGSSHKAADHRDNEDMAKVFGDVDYDLEHENREGDAWDP